MDPPPPPPPPHGANQQNGRPGGLPDGKYDIFVIPPHSAGSGFLYLPSLSTHRNSFLAGAVCTAFAFFVYSVAEPVVKQFFQGIMAGNSSGVMVLMIGVGVLCWAWGKTQAEGVNRPGTGPGPGTTGSSGGGSTTGASFGGHAPGPPPTGSAQPNPSAQPNTSTPPPGGTGPKSSWQRPNPQATGGTWANSSAKTSWEKAREEMRKKEEERRRTEEAKKRREEAEKERQKQREKDAREKEMRERRERREKEQREKAEKERLEKEKAERESADRERAERDRAERERAERERAEREKAEKEKAEKERERQKAASEPVRERSPPKRPPKPTVRTENEDDAYSFRPYDRPKKPVHKANSAASIYSESSYAPSQSTARTTPPPINRAPYTTKDPDKIIIKGVYSFNNAFMRTPIAQLISGSGNVTDGLILRITTEGLFIDDDVRGVPQREWDIKAWTMKLAESGEMMGLHILRASIRDQEGKKYVFVLSQSEGWKVALGLQRLRRGTQVRALGVSGLPPNETKALIENLGWA